VRGGRSSAASVQARRDAVLELVLERRRVAILELAERFGVSPMTAHRDLDTLSASGFLTKQRGVAVAPSDLHVQTSAAFRRRAAVELKQAVALAALPLVGRPTTIMVDDSTSVLPLVRLLGERASGPVQVVTNYLEVARAAGDYAALSSHLLGGDYVPDLDATFGEGCVEAVGHWHVDLAVLSVPAVRSGHCYHSLPASAAVKRAMLKVADRRMLLLDRTKLDRTAPHLLCGVGEFDVVVVDDLADADELAAFHAVGVEVVTVTPRVERPRGRQEPAT
jgi:DeoR/GlpR family transcriptional regulator of sugar metabolism